jgi:uncharacterized protein YcbX
MEAVMTAMGHVAALWRYPVKSMAAEQLDGAEVSWHGLAGDRRWAFIRWVGRVLRIGGLRMRVDQRDKRCVMVTIDPLTLRRDPAILRAIARERGGWFGVYGSTVEPGPVAVGDRVELEP